MKLAKVKENYKRKIIKKEARNLVIGMNTQKIIDVIVTNNGKTVYLKYLTIKQYNKKYNIGD